MAKHQYTRKPKFRGTYTDWGVMDSKYARDHYPEPITNCITLIIGLMFCWTMLYGVSIFGAVGGMLVMFAISGFKEDARKRKAGYY